MTTSSADKQARTSRRREGPAAAGGARERLLAGLPVVERRLRLAGVSTAVLESADGPPMVLLHGAGELALTWMRVIPGLAATHRVIVPDLPGHGASRETGGPLDSGRMLAWLDELIERTCSTPPVLVGHVLGGAIAARFAIHRGARLSRLVLVDTLGLGWFRPSPKFGLSLVGYLAGPTERRQDRLFRQCFVDLDGLRARTEGAMELVEALALEGTRDRGQQAALRHLMPRFGVRPIPPAELERIEVPTSLIWGRQDRQVRLRVAEAARARHHWPLHVVDHAADDPGVERPEAFLQALREALASDHRGGTDARG
jgi:pimeloyl-ACP methyl ester carboxylesterase